MGEKKAFKKFPKKQHIKNDTPSVQERVEKVYDDGRVLLKEKPHRNGRHPASFYGAGKIRMYAISVFALFFMIFFNTAIISDTLWANPDLGNTEHHVGRCPV